MNKNHAVSTIPFLWHKSTKDLITFLNGEEERMYTSCTIKIPTYSLYIHPHDLKELKSNVWGDEPVSAKLKIRQFQFDVEVVYRGRHTRAFPKKSYSIRFWRPASEVYGREFHLNAEYIDPSMLRNKLSLDFFKDIGVLSPTSSYVFLRINGAAAGVYLQLEAVDHVFLRKRNLPEGAIYYAINDDANFSLMSPITNDVKKSLQDGYERKRGNEYTDGRLRELIYKINTVSRSDFAREILRYVDVNKYLKWLLGVVCIQNFDGFIQNYALYRSPVTKRFEVIPWDCDGTWGRDCNGRVMDHDYVPIEGYNTLSARILDVPQFCRRYRTLLEEVLETKFTVAALEKNIVSLHKAVRPYYVLDPYRQESITQFDAEPDFILEFVKKRNRYLREHLTDLPH
jgi:spore coat protein H